LSGVAGELPESRVRELIRYADRIGVERFVLSMGFPFIVDPSPDELRAQNDQVLRAIRQFPDRALGFVYLNPAHVEFSLAELDRCVRDGPMVGVKLWIARHCNVPELGPIVERAAALKAVVFQHTWFKRGGGLPGESTPLELAELARRHPRAALICGHIGGDWERGIRAIRAFPNVLADVSGSDPTSGMVEMAVREMGAGRVLFGSDSGARSFASQLAKVVGAEIPAGARDLILGGNLRRILAPLLKAKGMAA
jgi:predicted TIM-barrel fold metal-dependent hydrolase